MSKLTGLSILLSTAATLLASQPGSAQPAQTKEATYSFNQPPQDLSEALIGFSRTTGLAVAAVPTAVNELRGNTVCGEFTAAQGLAALTRGLPLKASIERGMVTVSAVERQRIRPAVRPSPAPAPVRAETSDAEEEAPPASASAQAPEIVVTGFRESLSTAQALKKAATGIQEVIVAEDIAAFPDQNLAESLQRVPGVAISRDSGEGRQISLRGLGPGFTRTQLNGMEVLSNTASGLDSRGNVSRSRAFDYSVFASELFNRVVVEKAYSAEQEEGGIGGTIGLRTAKPFDYNENTFVVSAQGQVNEYTETLTPRLVGLASVQSGDFGALISAAYSKADTIEWGYRNWNWSKINFGPDNVGPEISDDVRDRLVNAEGDDRVWNSRAQTYASWFNQRERLGLTGTLQYEPGNGTDVTLDVLYGQLQNNRQENVLGNAGPNGLSSNDVTGTQIIHDVTIDEFGSITDATVSGVDLRNEAKATRDQTDFWQVVLNGQTELSDNLRLEGLAGWSSSKFVSSWQRAYLLSLDHTVSFSDLDTDTPVNSYDFDPADGDAWTFDRIQWRRDSIESEFYNAQLGLAWDVSTASTIKVGGEFKNFENSGYSWQTNGDHSGLDPVPTMLNPYDAPADFAVGDVDAIFDALGQDPYLDAEDLLAGTNYTVEERTFAAYAQYEIDTYVGDYGLRANFGARYYNTRLDSRGTSVTDSGLVPVSIRNTYDGFLPAVNLALDVTPDLVFRLGANRNISRPGFSDLSAAAQVRVAGYGGTISAGNPNLNPYRADSLEGSIEYYDGTRGFLAVGAFFKDMESFVTSETEQLPYGETGYPLDLLEEGQDGSIIFNFTRPINGPGASIQGVEAAARRDLDFLPGPLANLGLSANVTYADGQSDVFYSGTAYELPLVDLSKWTVNTTLYYETEKFGARASMAYRSRYRKGGGGNGNVGEYFTPSTVFDATAYYDVTPMLQLRVEGLNLTDQRIIQYADRDAERLMTSTVSGRTFTFGATLRF
ncbi:TonB-dependent receptor [Pacificimonas flava]|uniref:TonB-dependent receptor n=1 Tax=Pacificimonas flava TaxID=1234595 RepID=M2SDM1_9SPHN|nr:TonB-dependent receptor [Pacificimonas flava]EMD83460.1 TonB-dependent receptor [Pacificimonas flava]MBB5278981.1 TonB-dependent receptor [Pacificimonas flava]